MEFIDQLTALSARAFKQKDIIKTEEATKNALVMPFIQALGYDVFDPLEVIPEFIADVGSKKGEKVDYAIVMGGKLSMLFECKGCGSNLNDCHASQLRRYFHVTTARISGLTNGTAYRFYSDLEEPNKMDEKPFMEINLLEIDPLILPELKKLTKNSFELDKMLLSANDLKYTREIKNFLEGEFFAPSPEFVKFILGNVYTGLKTQPVIEQFTPIAKQAINLLINSHSEGWFALLVTFGEIAVGVALIFGTLTGIAAFFGALMNVSYLLAGSTSSNPVLFTFAIGLMLAWKVAGYYGLDRYLLPRLGTPWSLGSVFRRQAEPTAGPPPGS